MQLVDALSAEVVSRGLVIKREEYAVHKQGNVFFGVMDLNWQDNDEFSAALGIRTSNNRSFAIQLAVGARIFVCDHLAFSGDLIGLCRQLPKTRKLRLASH